MYIYINLYAYMYVHIYRKNRCGTTIFFTTILFHRFRKFANMNIQVPHFRGGFGITPNEGSAISAFYSATCALVVWLGSHGGNRPAQGFANTWAPGLNLTSPDSWHAPLLQSLSASHALLLQDYGCVEWASESDRVPAPLAVSIALPFVQPSVGSRNFPPPRYLL